MNISWFKNPDNVVYADINEFVDNFGRETGIQDLRHRIEELDAYPTKEGVILKGTKRTAIKLFIPDLVFDEHIEMGENVWVYMGENYECYCLYNIRGENYVPNGEAYKFFQHTGCEYFPCHRTVDEENFNCLFCYCPLYALGEDCGGNFIYMANGVKDCSGCMVPHVRGNYDFVMKKLAELYKKLADEKASEA